MTKTPTTDRFSKTGEPTQRQLRVGEEIRHALARILLRDEVPLQGVSSHRITVSEVRITPDLRHANAYFTLLGGGDTEGAVKILNSHSGEFRHLVTRDVTLKYSPTIRFKVDKSFEEADKINRLLNSPHVAQDLKKE